MIQEKSDEVVVVMKYGKPYGAKDQTHQAFLEGKHTKTPEVRQKYGNTTERSKNTVEIPSQT